MNDNLRTCMRGLDTNTEWEPAAWLAMSDLYEEEGNLSQAHHYRGLYNLYRLLVPVWDKLLATEEPSEVKVNIQLNPIEITLLNRIQPVGSRTIYVTYSNRIWVWITDRLYRDYKRDKTHRKYLISKLIRIKTYVDTINDLFLRRK